MTIEEMGQIFPNLNKNNARITSQEDYRYNCIAWAGGIASNGGNRQAHAIIFGYITIWLTQ